MNATVLLTSIGALIVGAVVLLGILTQPSTADRRRGDLTDRIQAYTTPGAASGQLWGEVDSQPSLFSRLRHRSETRAAAVIDRRGWNVRVATSLAGAGLRLKPEEWILLRIGCAFAAGLLFIVLSEGSISAAVVGGLLGFAAPILFLRLKQSRRRARFLNDLPDTLTAIASGLSAGASLPQAIEGTCSEASGPMGDELSRVMIDARLGIEIPDALEASAKRMSCRDLEMVVMAIRLQSQHGGNLSELLTTVSTTLRERVQMHRHVKALSAEGRLSLLVLMALPILMLAFLAVSRPEYFGFFISTGLGRLMLMTCAVMMLVGFFWGRAVVKVEV